MVLFFLRVLLSWFCVFFKYTYLGMKDYFLPFATDAVHDPTLINLQLRELQSFQEKFYISHYNGRVYTHTALPECTGLGPTILLLPPPRCR